MAGRLMGAGWDTIHSPSSPTKSPAGRSPTGDDLEEDDVIPTTSLCDMTGTDQASSSGHDPHDPQTPDQASSSGHASQTLSAPLHSPASTRACTTPAPPPTAHPLTRPAAHTLRRIPLNDARSPDETVCCCRVTGQGDTNIFDPSTAVKTTTVKVFGFDPQMSVPVPSLGALSPELDHLFDARDCRRGDVLREFGQCGTIIGHTSQGNWVCAPINTVCLLRVLVGMSQHSCSADEHRI
jgi:hypothetical protein